MELAILEHVVCEKRKTLGLQLLQSRTNLRSTTGIARRGIVLLWGLCECSVQDFIMVILVSFCGRPVGHPCRSSR